jgi:hypothetical protein
MDSGFLEAQIPLRCNPRWTVKASTVIEVMNWLYCNRYLWFWINWNLTKGQNQALYETCQFPKNLTLRKLPD